MRAVPHLALIATFAIAACEFSGVAGSDPDDDDAGVGSDAIAVDDLDADLTPTCLTAPSGIVAWWDGDTVLGADRTGNYPGSIARGNPSIEADGHVGQTTHFDNDEELSFDPAPSPAGFTIEGWVRRTENDNDYRTIYGRFATAGLFLYEHRLAYWDSSMNFGAGGRAVEGQTVLLPDTWYHVAASWDGTAASVYLDGDLESSTTPGVTINLPDPARSGGVSDGLGDNQSLRGDLDELTLYSRALSPAEISAIFFADTLGKCK